MTVVTMGIGCEKVKVHGQSLCRLGQRDDHPLQAVGAEYESRTRYGHIAVSARRVDMTSNGEGGRLWEVCCKVGWHDCRPDRGGIAVFRNCGSY